MVFLHRMSRGAFLIPLKSFQISHFLAGTVVFILCAKLANNILQSHRELGKTKLISGINNLPSYLHSARPAGYLPFLPRPFLAKKPEPGQGYEDFSMSFKDSWQNLFDRRIRPPHYKCHSLLSALWRAYKYHTYLPDESRASTARRNQN